MDLGSLQNNWWLAASPPNAYASPQQIDGNCEWQSAKVPGTVARAKLDLGIWQLGDNCDFDRDDWWFKTSFDIPQTQSDCQLCFDGLATLAEVWLNGHLILTSQNMFLTHQVEIKNLLKAENHLFICFRALGAKLAERLPRPRWKTRLVAEQQLRWFRTTLLGRIPGWTPKVAPVGPWRPVYLTSTQQRPEIIRQSARLESSLGCLDVAYKIGANTPVKKVELVINDQVFDLALTQQDYCTIYSTKQTLKDITPWWPHTHGHPTLYSLTLKVFYESGSQTYDMGKVGFKQVTLNSRDNQFSVSVNGQAIFCRGACWTTNDIVDLVGEPESLVAHLKLMRDAGANMIRVGGTMVYEQPLFYQTCDQLGLMVWQDFMFANMDYPFADETFLASVNHEVTQVTRRLSQHACVAIYCGSSEIEQQIAMLGFTKDNWHINYFQAQLATICSQQHPSIPYVTSSPSGGALPFHCHTGVSHYYGVGAYLRPVSEVRRHQVQFTSECLGFSNIPITKTRNAVLNGQIPVTHDPLWKQRTPRDSGTGWDFEDVRDHYLAEFYSVDPVKLRSFNVERYFQLSELVTGEIISQVMSEWRSNHSQCQGSLIWFMKDLWPGAGWGIIDSEGNPKACYYFAKRAWQPLAVLLTDESLNGLDIHLVNELASSFEGTLKLQLIDHKGQIMLDHQQGLTLEPQQTKTLNLDQLLGQFYDVTYSYRFGPSKHRAVAVSLVKDDKIISDATYFPENSEPQLDHQAALDIQIDRINEFEVQVALTSDRFLYAINIEIPHFLADDNFFNLTPNACKLIKFRQHAQYSGKFKGFLSSLSLSEDYRLREK